MNETQHRDALLAELLEQLIGEPFERQQSQLAEMVARSPDLESELRELWATAQLAEDLARGDSDASPPRSPLSGTDVRSTQRVSPPNMPRSIGDYELQEELGRGGMGVVWRARQIGLNRDVALKMILRGELASEVDIGRFRQEAEAAARLDHPHIVRVFDVGEFEGQPWFSMQYVDGSTLAQRLTQGPMPPREAAQLLIPVCRAIAHAHRQGILHRDLKPSNVLIDSGGQPYVTDFGLAKRVRTTSSVDGSDESESGAGGSIAAHSLAALTATGAILGTPAYMAPEQAAGSRGDVGPRTDIYSLGALLYAMLTGRAPFQAGSPVDVVLMVLEQDPRPPRVLNPQADPDLELIALEGAAEACRPALCDRRCARRRSAGISQQRIDLGSFVALFTDSQSGAQADPSCVGTAELGPVVDVARSRTARAVCADKRDAVAGRHVAVAVPRPVDAGPGDLGQHVLEPAAAIGSGHIRGASDRACLGSEHGLFNAAVPGGGTAG